VEAISLTLRYRGLLEEDVRGKEKMSWSVEHR